MKKNIIYTVAAVAALTAVLGGCSFGTSQPTEPTETEQTAGAADPTMSVLGEYALLEGYVDYTSPDGSFSIQLPEGSTVDDSDPTNVTVTLAGDTDTPNLINISKAENAQQISSTDELMQALANDNSIDITGFFKLMKDSVYEGYKYTYTSIDNNNLCGIVSSYFSEDGSAYTVNATINNGSDPASLEAVNTVVDTFINKL